MKDKMEARGAKVFLDVHNIQYGDDFVDKLETAIDRCDELVILVSPWALLSDWIAWEIGVFRGGRWKQGERRRLIGVLYGEEYFEKFRPKSAMLEIIKRTHYVKINQFDQYLEELSERIKAKSK